MWRRLLCLFGLHRAPRFRRAWRREGQVYVASAVCERCGRAFDTGEWFTR